MIGRCIVVSAIVAAAMIFAAPAGASRGANATERRGLSNAVHASQVAGLNKVPRSQYRVTGQRVSTISRHWGIARLVATRYSHSEPPLRFCYFAHAYRGVRPARGQSRELLQAGVELIGAAPGEGTVEVIEVLEAALDAAGLGRAVIGLGDADLYRQLLEELGVEGEARDSILISLATHDLVGLEQKLIDAGIGTEQAQTCVRLTQLRGGSEVLEQAHGLGGEAVERATARLSETYEELRRRGIADRVQIDLGLLRELGYYSGAILEVYDPALGHVLGGGGRYDGLMQQFGLDLSAAGFALYLDRVHTAQLEEARRG